MAKRYKPKFASKSRKSSLRVEALEQRQLLATISGGGVEVASNITTASGNIVDQILMTGASLTVTPDAGQVVRVSFLDNSGDIVQAEFAGSGKFKISLDNFKTAGGPADLVTGAYNNPNPVQTLNGATVNYVQGNATIIVDNPEFDTNVSVYSAGLATLPALFAGKPANQQGGNHFADIARIVIVGDPTNEAGYNNFGGIRAANAVFSSDYGVVGIRAENIAVQETVLIGDIDASGAGVPTLVFHPLSQFQQVKVAGGDLIQSNGSTFNTSGGSIAAVGGFNSFISIDGARSDFNNAATKQANIDTGAYMLRSGLSQEALALSARNQFVTMEGDWSYSVGLSGTGKATQTLAGQTYTYSFGGAAGSQSQLDKMFNERSFAGNLAVTGNLEANTEINLGKVAGTLDYTGNVLGRIEANGLFATIGALKINGNLSGEVFVVGNDRTLNGVVGGLDQFQNKIGSVTITGDVGSTSATGAYIIAEQIGDVNVTGNFSGLLSTRTTAVAGFAGTILSGTSYIDYTGSIGNVSIGGNISSGSIQGMTGIGNVNVGGNITGAGSLSAVALPGVFTTSAAQNAVAIGQSAASLSVGKIGTVTVVGDVDLNSTNNLFINIAEEGNFGDVSVQGNGDLGRVDGNDFLNFGRIVIATGFGNANNTTGTITIADAKGPKDTPTRGTDIDFGGVLVGTLANATGKIGAISITGKGEDTDLNFSGSIGAANLGGDAIEVTSVSAIGFEDIQMLATFDPNIGGPNAIQGSKIGTLTFTPINAVGTTDANDGKGTGIATSVTIAGNILVDDTIPNKGETIGAINIALGGSNNSAITFSGTIAATDFLKGTGSSMGAITLAANAVTFGSTVQAETIGAVTLTTKGGGLTTTQKLNGLTIGDFTASGGNTVTVGGSIGSNALGVALDRTESVGKISVSTTGTQAVGFSTLVFSDAVGAITLAATDGTITSTAEIDARTYQGVTGTYGAISAASSTRGNVTFNGKLWGTGGDITLSTGTVGTNSGDIIIGTSFVSGTAGNLTATTVGIVAGNTGDITYNADVEGGSIGKTTLTASVNGIIAYGGTSHFAGNVGDVAISNKSTGTVGYTGAFATTGDSTTGGTDSGNITVGLVTINAETGNVTINPFYDDKVVETGALAATTTSGKITYAASTVGSGVATVGAAITGGTQAGKIGAVNLLTTGADGDIIITAQLEADSFVGLTAETKSPDTTGPATSASIQFGDLGLGALAADIWAASVGPITVTTAEGAINVDSDSSFRGFTNGTGTAMSVAAITMTATAKGAIVFNGLVEATTNQSAGLNNGAMSIGDFTLSGNSAGGIAFGGQIQTGKYDAAVNIALLDGVVDQGTIGKITFNGNTTLSNVAQFGTQATQSHLGINPALPGATAQALQNGFVQNGQLALGTSKMGAFTVNGNLTAVGGTGVDGLIRAQVLDGFAVSGVATLIADGTNVQTLAGSITATGVGLIFVPQLGALSFGSAAATGSVANLTATVSSPVFVAHDIASITFNNTQTNLNGGTVFLALDATADRDTIGPITGTGRIVGNAVTNFAGTPRAEFEASSIGAINITAAVDGSFVPNALTNVDFRASNLRGNPTTTDQDPVTVGVQPGTHALTGEVIFSDGSNVTGFALGDVKITANQVGSLTNTSLFGGANSFVANGAIGNISLVGTNSGITQPAIFNTPGDSAWFTVGDGDSIGSITQSGTDFDGNGLITGTAEINSDFTGGRLQVGNVFINVDNTTHALPPIEDFDSIGGAVGGGGQTDGLAILVGVQLDTAGLDGVGRGAVGVLALGDRIDAQLSGQVGTVNLQNGQITNQANVVARATVVAEANTAGFGAVIAVAGDGNVLTDEVFDLYNDVAGPNVLPDGTAKMNENILFNTAVVGNKLAGVGPALPINQDRWDDGEVLVYVL